MACNNRLCGVCHHRFGEHRVGDDACPGGAPGEFRETTFQKWTPSRSPSSPETDPAPTKE
jgi:hypothetical protein